MIVVNSFQNNPAYLLEYTYTNSVRVTEGKTYHIDGSTLHNIELATPCGCGRKDMDNKMTITKTLMEDN
jgi:hypothetical protein